MKRKLTSTSSMSMPPKGTRRFTAKRRKVSTTLGRIAGKISPNSTTLSQAIGPFSNKKYMTFLYENSFTHLAPGTPGFTVSCAPNSLYDFDKTSLAYLGNKQPLYYDTMLTASGPYKSYQVISWKTTYTVVNQTATPITVFAFPPITAQAEIDSVAEADNFPGVKRLELSASTGSKNIGTVTVTGHQNDAFPVQVLTGNSTTASYAGDPGAIIYQGLYIITGDGSTNLDVYVSVKHEAYSELQNVDALVS